ncbi:MAG: hypothetical protein PHH01_03860 [Patescibacteria group bacterium]|nr:hypothetical protein [Patescibacteria group bacterium]
MRKDFYRQEKGILIVPEGKSKFNVSWSLDNILCGFRKFYEEHNRWPDFVDINSCIYLPNVKTIERKFKGITNIRNLLGLRDLDRRKGDIRSKMTSLIGERGYNLENYEYKILINRFHEPFVHNQARVVLDMNSKIVNKSKTLNVDFLIYCKEGKFSIDVFYPSKDIHHFSNNVSMKYNIYKNFPLKIYLCVGNPDIDNIMIEKNMSNAKYKREENIELVTLNNLNNNILKKYTPLKDPYYIGS